MLGKIAEISLSDKTYPPLLKQIPDPPSRLYFCGNIDCLKEKCFAVVGTRRCSAYGKELALNIAGELASAGLTIVSGLAPGIDTFAHLAALERKQKTIAVLGTGLDEKSLYPKSNLGLAKRIVETQGCLVSEYPPGTAGSKITFPKRNRIISGLSLGVLVVEAKLKSGALITAAFAKSQKRKLFAIPGPVNSLNSQGPNLLIKKDAILTRNSEDILRELKLKPKPKTQTLRTQAQSGPEALILGCLKEAPLEINQIIEITKLPAAQVISLLTLLEIEGRVRNLGQNTYVLSHR